MINVPNQCVCPTPREFKLCIEYDSNFCQPMLQKLKLTKFTIVINEKSPDLVQNNFGYPLFATLGSKFSRFAHGSAHKYRRVVWVVVELDSCENSKSRCFHLQGFETMFVAFKGFLDNLNRCAYPKTSILTSKMTLIMQNFKKTPYSPY